MSSGIRDVSSVFGSRLTTLLLSVAIQSCLAWFLGPADRGSYAVALMFASLLKLFFSVSCDTAGIYFVSSRRFTLSEGIIHTAIYGGVSSVLAILTGLILMQLPLSFFDKAAGSAFYLALLSIPFTLFSFVFIQLCTAVHDFFWFALMSVLMSLFQLVFIVLFVKIFSWGVNGALFASIIRASIAIVLTLVLFRIKYKLRFVKPSFKSLMNMFHYGLRYYVGKISNLINVQIGTIILAFFATKEAVGFFDIASQTTTKTMLIPDTLHTVLIPKVAQDPKGKKHIVAQCSRLTALICGTGLFLFAVFAEPIVKVLFSPDFLPVVPLIRVLTIGVFVRSACKLFVPYLLGTDHPGIASWSVVIGVAVNIVVLIILLPVLGLIGAAIAVTASYFISSSILTVFFSRFSGLGMVEIWKYRKEDFELMKTVVKKVLPGRNKLQRISSDEHDINFTEDIS